ncbi:spore coat associated protein CotJA [[Eubacterium] hominis]|uniref:spore coat associated protein CotJA n=1 Tax=[Eubacterium] hominis TaxID=2764325 RepID=UPI003A4E3831
MIYEYDDAQWYEDSCYHNDQKSNRPKQSVGMTYVPMQRWSDPMPLEDGFYLGTVFCDLNKPFQP